MSDDAEVLAAKRDASFYQRPGQAWQYHIVVGDWTPACNQTGSRATGVLLVDFTATPAANVLAGQRCRRPGCAKRWPKAGA